MKLLTGFVCGYHLVLGAGLAFSHPFQRLLVEFYGADPAWTPQLVYLVRVLGTFALALGLFALPAARDPLTHPWPIVAFVVFFVLRDLSRHLFADELHAGFGLSPAMNVLTSVVFGAQALALAVLLGLARRQARRETAASVS